MNRRLFLHIGTEKTGTSTIQNTLFNNQKVLTNQGYHFLQCAGKRNNRAIPAYCMERDKYDDFFKNNKISELDQKLEFRANLEKEIESELNSLPSSIHSVIISSEHFHSRNTSKEEVKNVKNLLKPYFNRMKVICYLREQSSTCISLYSTAVKSGSTSSLDEYISGCNPANIYYNYFDMLNNWCDVFGIGNLEIRKFNRDCFINNDLIDDFLSLINPELISYIDKPIDSSNESLNPFGHIIGKAVNKCMPKYLEDGNLNIHRQKVMTAISRKFNGEGMPLKIEKYDEIYNSFSLSNTQLCKKYLDKNENLFHYAPPKQTNDGLNDDSLLEGLIEIINIISSPTMELSEPNANLFRDAALIFEKKDLKKSLQLMELAAKIKPNGPLIKKKIGEYKSKIKQRGR